MSTTHSLFTGIHLGYVRNDHPHMGGSWDITSMALGPGKSKWLMKGNLEEMSHKSDSNHQECVTLSEPAHVAIHMYCTLILSNKHFTCFTTFHHYGNYFPQSWRTSGLALSTGLIARIRLSHCHNLASTSGWKAMPCFKPLKIEVLQDQHYYKSASLSLSPPQQIWWM